MDETNFISEALNAFNQGNWPAFVGLLLAGIAVFLRGQGVLLSHLSPAVASVVTVLFTAFVEFGHYFVSLGDMGAALAAAAKAAIMAAVALIFPTLDHPVAQPKVITVKNPEV